jgi:hypothetical protein
MTEAPEGKRSFLKDERSSQLSLSESKAIYSQVSKGIGEGLRDLLKDRIPQCRRLVGELSNFSLLRKADQVKEAVERLTDRDYEEALKSMMRLGAITAYQLSGCVILAIGVEQILRSEESLKQAKALYPEFVRPLIEASMRSVQRFPGGPRMFVADAIILKTLSDTARSEREPVGGLSLPELYFHYGKARVKAFLEKHRWPSPLV